MAGYTLDALCGDAPNITLIKVDIDNEDIGVLRGAVGIIDKHRPWISVECWTDQNKRELAEFCKKHWYAVAGTYCATPTCLLQPR
jgi:hypothetical protein